MFFLSVSSDSVGLHTGVFGSSFGLFLDFSQNGQCIDLTRMVTFSLSFCVANLELVAFTVMNFLIMEKVVLRSGPPFSSWYFVSITLTSTLLYFFFYLFYAVHPVEIPFLV